MNNSDRQYWLWVTHPEHYDSVGLSGSWSCHKDTKKGDLAFLYRAKGKSDINHLLQVESDAVPDDRWGNSCQYKTLYKFKNPITLEDLKKNKEDFKDWGAYSGNFQRSNFDIPLNNWEKLNQIAISKNPEYEKIYESVDNFRQNSIQLGLENILSRYINVRNKKPFGKHNEIWNYFDFIREDLIDIDPILKYPSLNVSWSLGQGNWAKIPWIALLDTRETDTIQQGVYVVFLFREDMSGVYLTLAQGVTKLNKEMKSTEVRAHLRKKATEIRTRCKELLAKGFLW